MSKSSAFFTGLVVGSVAVGVAAYLQTPKGKETAQKLLANSDNLTNLLTDLRLEGSSITEEIVKASKEGFATLQELRKDIDKASSSIIIPQHDSSYEEEIHDLHEKINDIENSKVVS